MARLSVYTQILCIVLGVFCLSLTCPPGAEAQSQPAQETIDRSDLNKSGAVTVTDILMLKKCIDNPQCDEERFDLNDDGLVNNKDLTLAREVLNHVLTE